MIILKLKNTNIKLNLWMNTTAVQRWQKNKENLKTAIELPNLKNRKKIRLKKSKQNHRVLWDNKKQCNASVVGITGQEREKGEENIFEEIMAENF